MRAAVAELPVQKLGLDAEAVANASNPNRSRMRARSGHATVNSGCCVNLRREHQGVECRKY